MKWIPVILFSFACSPESNEKIKASNPEAVASVADPLAGIRGTDKDLNGIRDDVEKTLEAMPLTNGQQKAAAQLARTLQSTLLVDTNDPPALRAASQNISRAVNCLSRQFPNIQQRSSLITRIEGLTFNNQERSLRALQFNKALSGSVSRLPSGDTCEEDLLPPPGDLERN